MNVLVFNLAPQKGKKNRGWEEAQPFKSPGSSCSRGEGLATKGRHTTTKASASCLCLCDQKQPSGHRALTWQTGSFAQSGSHKLCKLLRKQVHSCLLWGWGHMLCSELNLFQIHCNLLPKPPWKLQAFKRLGKIPDVGLGRFLIYKKTWTTKEQRKKSALYSKTFYSLKDA